MNLTIRVPFGGNWRIRHYGLPLITAALGAYTAAMWALPPSHNWQGRAVRLTALTAIAAGTFLAQAHEQGTLCERCGQLPEDVEARARRRRPLLAWDHITRGTQRRHRVSEAIFWALVIGPMLAPAAWGPALATAGFAWVTTDLWATRMHNRLAWWCPWCRRGGDDENTPAPEPRIPLAA
ncbi:hypothetical protein AQI95_41800 [Streptomyces yokosukanensis]|uniref:Uncharacterized protein n=1 Tax=Streptomyces yokosukanensis TaxID=67386 RepID=A0A124HDF0_9ACTN|nr:hypothetical protein [Streptomyces yokosukanensis]KUM97357.1 hypothetical protein AQI95_41800 [Streptomyces yokosukanensis]